MPLNLDWPSPCYRSILMLYNHFRIYKKSFCPYNNSTSFISQVLDQPYHCVDDEFWENRDILTLVLFPDHHFTRSISINMGLIIININLVYILVFHSFCTIYLVLTSIYFYALYLSLAVKYLFALKLYQKKNCRCCIFPLLQKVSD